MQTSHDIIERRGAERYEQYRLFEEKTDIGERLSLPIENRLQLEVMDGRIYGRDIEGSSRRMVEWAWESYDQALRDPSFSGSNSIERTRRLYEYHEAVQVEELQAGEAMIVFSPIPDAALEDKLTIQGYRTDLARTFCRLYYRGDEAVDAVTLSLERSDKQALLVAATAIGMTLPTSLQSEDILSTRHTVPLTSEAFSELPDRIRYHYDKALFDRTGVVYYAGNRLAGRQDSMSFIDANHDIIDEHMAVLRSIESRLNDEALRHTELELLRRRTAAALDERLHGGTVVSIGDVSVSDRVESGNYGGECAIGVSASTQEAMGLAQGKHTTNCPLCGTQGVTATVEGETITCSDCRGSVNICTGQVRQGRRKRVESLPSAISMRQEDIRPKQTSLEAQLSLQYGEKVVVKRLKTIGGEDSLVMNQRGEVITKL